MVLVDASSITTEMEETAGREKTKIPVRGLRGKQGGKERATAMPVRVSSEALNLQPSSDSFGSKSPRKNMGPTTVTTLWDFDVLAEPPPPKPPNRIAFPTPPLEREEAWRRRPPKSVVEIPASSSGPSAAVPQWSGCRPATWSQCS